MQIEKQNKPRTIAYAMPLVQFQQLCKNLINAGHNLESSGSVTNPEGHQLGIEIDGIIHFWAMIHSNQKSYLVRATPALIQTEDK